MNRMECKKCLALLLKDEQLEVTRARIAEAMTRKEPFGHRGGNAHALLDGDMRSFPNISSGFRMTFLDLELGFSLLTLEDINEMVAMMVGGILLVGLHGEHASNPHVILGHNIVALLDNHERRQKFVHIGIATGLAKRIRLEKDDVQNTLTDVLDLVRPSGEDRGGAGGHINDVSATFNRLAFF